MNKEVLIEYLTFKPLPQQLHEAKMNPRSRFLVSGKVQAADKPNANHELLKNNMDLIVGYFKSHPTETYKLDGIPRIKREVIDRAGIKDYSRIGRNIRSGAI